MKTKRCHCEPVGMKEIAALFGVPIKTAISWHARGRLPEPRWPSVGGRPAWDKADIVAWAEARAENKYAKPAARLIGSEAPAPA